ncbi:UNVERIFIED_CONTAM: hypothetical protein PYX00_009037 [Menopon gallinae]|uniref:CN hydrolase domain-containing protein n=1 Tax=Menopon gallinae TaxID=328185 RepID=A0AAW2H9S9_9NEOP
MKMNNFELFITLILLFQLSIQRVQAMDGEPKSYKAVVVEYNRDILTSENIKKYQKYIENSGNEKSDIIIFPESTLTMTVNGSLVPSPEDKVTPYKNETYLIYEAVRAMSEAAAKSNVYVVVNLFERVECTNGTKDCPSRGYFLYNTNVAFDRKGTVVAKYRKYNIYNNKTDKPEKQLSTFTTDFGVTFGMMNSFDILFKAPSIELVREKKVTNLLFSAFWFGGLPFLTASQVQAGWSYAMNVTLLASGANNPTIGTTGSGLYLGRGKSYRAMREIDMSVMSLFTIHVKDLSDNLFSMSEFRDKHDALETHSRTLNLLSDPSIPLSTGKDLDTTSGNFDSEICNGGLCCRFGAMYRNSTIPNTHGYKYKAIVYQGMRRFGENNWHETAHCGIVLCIGENCAKKPPNDRYPLIFDEIKIEGRFKGKDTFQMPTTLVYKRDDVQYSLLDILDNDNFSFNSERVSGSDTANVFMKLLKKNVGNLVAFGIYGRIF